MFPMVKKPYNVSYGTVCCDNAIDHVRSVSVVAKCGARRYSSDAVDKPGAVCAFYVYGRASLKMRGNYFKCLVHRMDDGSLWLEPVTSFAHNQYLVVDLFGPRTTTACTGHCAKHGIDYSEFTTADADMIRMAIELYITRRAEAVAAH